MEYLVYKGQMWFLVSISSKSLSLNLYPSVNDVILSFFQFFWNSLPCSVWVIVIVAVIGPFLFLCFLFVCLFICLCLCFFCVIFCIIFGSLFCFILFIFLFLVSDYLTMVLCIRYKTENMCFILNKHTLTEKSHVFKGNVKQYICFKYNKTFIYSKWFVSLKPGVTG